MDIIITEWALQSYLDLKHKGVFTVKEYWQVIRPDVERLEDFPNDPKFGHDKFWGPATDKGGNKLPDGFKMKWRNIGPGKVQLRLSVAILRGAFLCDAYVKNSPQKDKRECAKLKRRINLIHQGKFKIRGKL